MSEEILEVILDLANSLEAAAVSVKQQIAQITGIKEWNPNKIKWENAEGAKGPYERSKDVGNPQHKALLGDLKAHGGRITRDDTFYWIFEDGNTVGRKKRGKDKADASEAPGKIKQLFPEPLRTLLSFEETPECTLIRPRQFLGSENFSKTTAIVRNAGGEYISAGKQSRFRIPR